MGFRNHLHVCQHCGIVHATASSTGPVRCVVCDAFTFSEYDPTASQPVEADGSRRVQAAAGGRPKRGASNVKQPLLEVDRPT